MTIYFVRVLGVNNGLIPRPLFCYKFINLFIKPYFGAFFYFRVFPRDGQKAYLHFSLLSLGTNKPGTFLPIALLQIRIILLLNN